MERDEEPDPIHTYEKLLSAGREYL